MGKIRVDGRTMSLSHPTRLAMYEELLNAEEMSTVMLQKSTGVTRYHLYHHLQSLEKNGLVENHRNEGRARWWRVTERVTLTPAAGNDWLDNIPAEVQSLLQSGARMHYIAIPSGRDVTTAKKALDTIAEMYGAEKTGVTLMPNGILVLGPPKRS
ncbi:MAG: winged helix-turn-helix domain-containing protein [Candidatus Thalassarchaeaceae archaeon]|jgi:DNA-binding transcriptional ArsR family regulator|nr:winged helix-turn-helix domain-containing protein [Candidatus Thalassarchaeaceae archaeon]